METKQDFSNPAYLFPHINRDGMRFGAIALIIAIAVAVLAAHLHNAVLTALSLPLLLLAYGVKTEVRPRQIMVADETVPCNLN